MFESVETQADRKLYLQMDSFVFYTAPHGRMDPEEECVNPWCIAHLLQDSITFN